MLTYISGKKVVSASSYYHDHQPHDRVWSWNHYEAKGLTISLHISVLKAEEVFIDALMFVSKF